MGASAALREAESSRDGGSGITVSAEIQSAISMRASSVRSRNCRPASVFDGLSQVIWAVAAILFLDFGGWMRRLTRVRPMSGLKAWNARPLALRSSTIPPLSEPTSRYAREKIRCRVLRRRSPERGKS